MKKIYLACPYTHNDPAIKVLRFTKANRAAANLMAEGYLVFSPISHTHPIVLAGKLPGHWEFWESYDKTFIEWCDEIYVLQIEGWDTSTGVTAEIGIAEQLGKPVVYISESE